MGTLRVRVRMSACVIVVAQFCGHYLTARSYADRLSAMPHAKPSAKPPSAPPPSSVVPLATYTPEQLRVLQETHARLVSVGLAAPLPQTQPLARPDRSRVTADEAERFRTELLEVVQKHPGITTAELLERFGYDPKRRGKVNYHLEYMRDEFPPRLIMTTREIDGADQRCVYVPSHVSFKGDIGGAHPRAKYRPDNSADRVYVSRRGKSKAATGD